MRPVSPRLRLHARSRRRASRPCRAAACPRCPARRACPPASRSSPRRPRSSRRGCRACRRSASIQLGGQVAGQRRAARRDHLQRGRVVLRARLLGQLEDALHHHRHHRQRVGARAGDLGEARLGVELAAQHVASMPSIMPSVKWAKPHEWNSGAATWSGLPALQRDLRQERDGGVDRLGIAARRALRRAGGARREDDGAALGSGGTTGLGSPSAISSSSVGSALVASSCQATKRLRRVAGVLEQPGELLVVDRSPSASRASRPR